MITIVEPRSAVWHAKSAGNLVCETFQNILQFSVRFDAIACLNALLCIDPGAFQQKPVENKSSAPVEGKLTDLSKPEGQTQQQGDQKECKKVAPVRANASFL